MRKSREVAAETRKRIVRAAARKFREQGIVATGLNDLMKAAGLTHGGFYKHFESKDQLVAEACADAVDAAIAEMGMEAQPTINAAVAAYLSTRHRDDPASGCPLAAIGSELSRTDKKTREAATQGFKRLVAVLAGEVEGPNARRRAPVAVAWLSRGGARSAAVNDTRLAGRSLTPG